MRALTQHGPHMSSCCLPAGTPTPIKDAGRAETHLLTAGAPHMRAPVQHEPHMSPCCSPAGALTATKTAGGVRAQLRARRPRRWGGTVASSTMSMMVNEADAGSSRTGETPGASLYATAGADGCRCCDAAANAGCHGVATCRPALGHVETWVNCKAGKVFATYLVCFHSPNLW
ncbi:hypothetical protein GALMADRAFT_720335 [Galerina marginata CBS 339.88]|uniref:Uncharacterized protein n=1 Tax=Galerina marginata (strain CBS 339.88) TaxID=685588 RepID=A0A067TQQ6_GALM3|nr:hypothetical protein GALMADRAFT_720335 [Galerina marginata CBS 339.88]